MADDKFYTNSWGGQVPEELKQVSQDKGLIIKNAASNNIEYLFHSGFENASYEANKKILYLGCGTGENLIMASFSSDDVFYATDPYPDVQEIAEKYVEEMGLKNVHFIDFSDFLAETDHSSLLFDLIILNRPLQHFEDVELLFAVMKKSLTQDGIIELFSWTGSDPFEHVVFQEKFGKLKNNENDKDLYIEFCESLLDYFKQNTSENKGIESILGLKDYLNDFGFEIFNGVYHQNYNPVNYLTIELDDADTAWYKQMSFVEKAFLSEQLFGDFLAHRLLLRKVTNKTRIPDVKDSDVKSLIAYKTPFFGAAKKEDRILLGLKHRYLELNSGLELEDLSLPPDYFKIFIEIDGKKNVEQVHRRVLPMGWDEFYMVLSAFFESDLIYFHRK